MQQFTAANTPMAAMPPGYRFDPTDEELVGHYLYNKLSRNLLPWEEMIVSDCELYGKEEPWEIWERFGGNGLYGSEDLYFFTKLKKKKLLKKKKTENNNNNGSSRIDRRVGCGEGNWHREDSGQEFKAIVTVDGDGGFKEKYWVQALKKRFNYRNTKSSHHCRWILHEYSLPNLNSELVLCHLRKNGSVSQNGSVMNKTIKGKRKVDDCEGDEFRNCEIVKSDKRLMANQEQISYVSELSCESGAILGGSEVNDMVNCSALSTGFDQVLADDDIHSCSIPNQMNAVDYIAHIEKRLLKSDDEFDHFHSEQNWDLHYQIGEENGMACQQD